MTFDIDVTPEEDARLRKRAEDLGMTVEALILLAIKTELSLAELDAQPDPIAESFALAKLPSLSRH